MGDSLIQDFTVLSFAGNFFMSIDVSVSAMTTHFGPFHVRPN